MNRKNLLATLVCLLGMVTALSAADYRISVNQFVEHPALDAVLKGFQEILKEKGFDIEYKIHNAQANMGTATQISNQIIGEDPDLVLAIATPSAQASVQALKKAPSSFDAQVLFSAVTDPKAAGLVQNLERPEGRVTGVSDMLPISTQVQLIENFLPDLKKLGTIYNAGESNSRSLISTLRNVSNEVNIKLIEATASKSSEVYQAAKSLVGRVDAIYITTDNTAVTAFESIVKVGMQHQIPIFAGDIDSVKRGAVAAIGFDYFLHGRQTGKMAIKLLKGQSVAKTPIEMQKELLLHVSKKNGAKMGIMTPQEILDIANKVY